MGERPDLVEGLNQREAYPGMAASSGPRVGIRSDEMEYGSVSGRVGKTDTSEETTGEPDVAAARAQIEQTRTEMSVTIDAIQERLDPQVLVQQAKDAARDVAQEKVAEAKAAVRQATIGKVEDAVGSVTQKVQDVVGSAGEAISGGAQRVQSAVGAGSEGSQSMRQYGPAYDGTGSGWLQTVRRHPLPAAMAAAGIGWLYMSSRKDGQKTATVRPYSAEPRNGGYRESEENGYGGQGAAGSGVVHAVKAVPDVASQAVSQAKDSASQLGSQAMESASQLGSQATQQMHQARSGLEQLLQQNPLAVAAVAVGVGALAGLAVPETDKENELMGQAHDSLMDRAGQAAQETAQRVQNVAREAMSAAKEEAHNQDLLPES